MRVQIRKISLVLLIVSVCFGLTGGFVLAAKDTVSIMLSASWRSHPAFEEAFERFEADTGAEVKVIWVPGQEIFQRVMTTLAGGGSGVDVMALDSTWTPALGSAGYLTDLSDRFTDRDKFLDVAVEAVSWKDTVVAIPWFTVAGFTFLRADLYEEAGLEAPRTWGDLVAVSKKLTVDTDQDGSIDRWGYGWTGKAYDAGFCDFMEFVWQAGGNVFDDEGNVIINNEAGVKALQFLVDLVYKHKVAPKAVFTYTVEDLTSAFMDERIATIRNWPYVYQVANGEDSPLKGKVKMIANPGNVRATASTFGSWNLGIPKKSRKKDLAWKLIQYMTSYQTQKETFLLRGEMPSRKSVFDDPEVVETIPPAPEMLKGLLGAMNRPQVPEYGEIAKAVQDAFSAAYYLQKDPQEALDEAAAKIEKIMGR